MSPNLQHFRDRFAVEEFFDFVLDQSLDAGLAETKVPQIAQREAADILPSLAFAEDNTYWKKFDNRQRIGSNVHTSINNNKTFFIGENIDNLKIWPTSEDFFLERVSDCTQRIQDHRPDIMLQNTFNANQTLSPPPVTS